MKKILGILVLLLFFYPNSSAFFSTAIFKKDKELNFNHFFNFDISKFSFEDHEKIIGSDFEKWDGDPGKKGKDEIDYKKISVLVDGDKQELKLRKFKKGIWLQLDLEGYSCKQAKSKIPQKFINKKHYSEYVTDFTFLKFINIDFTYDNKGSRVNFSCMQIDESDEGRLAFLSITSKNEEKFPKVTPLKAIACRIDEAKTNINNKWDKMQANTFINLFIQEYKKTLLTENKINAGKNKTFNDEKIHVIKETKNDLKKKTIYREYVIDRINGSFKFRRKDFDPDIYANPRYGINDGIIIVDYVGMCEMKTTKKKF